MGVSSSKEKKASAQNSQEQPQLNDRDAAVLELKRLKVRLHKSLQTLEHKLEEEHAALQVTASLRDNAELRRERAKAILRRVKMHEKRRNELLAQQLNIDTLLTSIHDADANRQLVIALDAGRVALQKINDEIAQIGDVNELMDLNAEAIADHERISEALSGAMSDESVDIEADVLKELEDMMRAEGSTSQVNHQVSVTQPPAVTVTSTHEHKQQVIMS